MLSSSKRKGVAAIGLVAVMALAAACSSGGGSNRVSVGPGSTTSTVGASGSSSSAPASISSAHRTKKSKGAGVAHTKATTRGSLGATVTVPVTSQVAPQGPGETATATPTTGAPATTVPRTTTTIEGPQPYDPTKPINLGGEPGVTPAEVARAEKLVRDTLRDLPKYANWQVAYADGYRSIGDASTGYEHFVKWSLVNDGHILDSQLPESVVYRIDNGNRTLVAAMYMLPFGSTFADVPDVGGPLTQWHVHDDLCLADNPMDPLQKVISTLTTVNGACPAGSTKAGSSPMLHVWVVANACGPFASLEGISAGQVPPGQTRHCDRAHG